MKSFGIIIQIDEKKTNPLRHKAVRVTKEEFGSKELKSLVSIMEKTLAGEKDGVALAAPQIGVSKRIFVISPQAYPEGIKWRPLVFINPIITKRSKKTEVMQEGCLSVRWVYGKTKRAVRATVEAYDVNGKRFTYGATGLLAHIFQHETDHLDGVLFIDHGFDFEEYTEKEIEAAMKQK